MDSNLFARKKRAERLDSIIAKYAIDRQIHFLKIDVEGFEFKVLNSMDFAESRPWILIVECVEPLSQTPSHEDWEHLLLS
jgi:FkbM family methyltransferase